MLASRSGEPVLEFCLADVLLTLSHLIAAWVWVLGLLWPPVLFALARIESADGGPWLDEIGLWLVYLRAWLHLREIHGITDEVQPLSLFQEA